MKLQQDASYRRTPVRIVGGEKWRRLVMLVAALAVFSPDGKSAAQGTHQGYRHDNTPYCQQWEGNPHGAYPRTLKNIPCGPNFQKRPQSQMQKIQRIFHYYYINGINTPMDQKGPDGKPERRGTYRAEYGLVKDNIVARVKHFDRHASSEIDLMEKPTHNPSGADPTVEPLFRWACVFPLLHNRKVELPGCRFVGHGIDCIKRNMTLINGTPGDFLESFRQSIPGSALLGGTRLAADAQLVREMVQDMIRIDRSAGRGTPGQPEHYYIVVAHSQGNFFAEDLAQHLATNQRTLARRTGILGLASPTDYADVRHTGIPIITLTRGDDIILIVEDTLRVGPFHMLKRPAPPNLPPFDPTVVVNAPGNVWAFWWNLPGEAWRRLSGAAHGIWHCVLRHPPTSSNDSVFDVPRVNAHVIDSYLLEPLPPPGKNPVLNKVLQNVVALKEALR